MKINLPTTLTLLRIILIPVLVLFCYLPVGWSNIACVIVFFVAGVTDWLDGFLARRWQQMTAFGAFLDPVADKLMVAVALVLIVQQDPAPSLAIASAIIIGREITITSLREWMAELGERAKIKVSWLGKVKTAFQMLAIVILLYGSDYENIPLRDIGYSLLFIAAVLTLWSMVNYIRAALPLLKREL
jgi:CDP-diacylglycerol--glycerol-3-phosphate 3-phosphatidyltransferase